MNISEDKIDDFVNGRLPKEEMNEIIEMAKSNPDLNTAIEDAKLALVVANQLISEDIRSMTDQWRVNANNNTNGKDSKNNVHSYKSLLFLALGFVLFLVLAYVMFNQSNDDNSSELLQKPETINTELSPVDSIANQSDEKRPINSPTKNEENSEKEGSNSKEASEKSQPNSQRMLIASRLMPTLEKESILRSESNSAVQSHTTKIIELYNQKDIQGLKKMLLTQKQNSAIQIFTKELIARILFDKGDYKEAIIIFEELANFDLPNRDEYEFMLLLSYYISQPLSSEKYNYLKNQIANDKYHTYNTKINQLN